jgi:hypothetical protein
VPLLLKESVEVPELNVSPVVDEKFQPLVPEQVIVELPREIALVPEPEFPQELFVHEKLPVLNVPFIKVTLVVDVNALPNVQPPPAPLKTMVAPPNEIPLVVMVFPVAVDANVNEPI